MTSLEPYITAVLMRDLVGHDHRPASFLVYLWLMAEHQSRKGAMQISYQDLADETGLSKSSVQSAVNWLARRKLIAVSKENATATPGYTVLTPWKRRH
jgi:Mn-dependent DtxR family transcriptional regulator